MVVLVDTEGQNESLKLLKRLIKHDVSGKEVIVEAFQNALEAKKKDVCKALQHLLFGEEEVRKSAEDIDKAVKRVRGLFVHTTKYSEEEFKAELYIATLGEAGAVGVYPISGYVDHMFTKIIIDLYHYLSQDGISKHHMLKNLKVLKEKYADEAKWMVDLEGKCEKIFKGKKSLNKSEFRRVIQYQKELSDRIFDKFDRTKSGVLNIHELYEGLVGILTSDTEGKLKYLFDIYDIDDSGTLDKEELNSVLSMCVSESSLDLHEEIIGELSNIVWGNLTDWTKNGITFAEFFSTLKQFPSILDNINANVIGCAEVGQTFRFLQTKKRNKESKIGRAVKRHCVHLGARFTTNLGLWLMMFIYFGVSIALVVERIIDLLNARYPAQLSDIWYFIAKIAGQLLNFNISFVILLTIKHTFAKLRKCTFLRRFIPFDDLLFLHKTSALITLVLGLIHTIAHVLNIIVEILWKGQDKVYFLNKDDPILRIFVTGVILVVSGVLFAIGTLTSLKDYSYQAFIRLHQICAITWVVCMVLHGANFWRWILGPAILFVGERLYFAYMMWLNRTGVESGVVHGNITQLTIKRPENFKYEPGDYVNINIPHLSRGEWHPFTISSSTDHRPDHFTLHIRKAGRWTGMLHKTVTAESKKANLDGHKNDALTQSFQSLPNDTESVQSQKDSVSVNGNVTLVAARFKKEYTQSELPIPVFTISKSEPDHSDEEDRQSNPESLGSISQGEPSPQLLSPEVYSTNSWSSSIHENEPQMRYPGSKTSTLRSEGKLSRYSSMVSVASVEPEDATKLDWKVYLDGPYSTPSKEIMNTKHAIMVAGGIGVTPFASVLETVMTLLKEISNFRYSDFRTPSATLRRRQTPLRRIDFFWITRDQTHLSWFHKIFKEIEEAQRVLGITPPLVNLHIYLTGLKSSSDIRGTFLQLALEMIYKEENCDVLSGLKAKTRAGRPKWNEVLREITKADRAEDQKLMRPKLYVCGPNALCSELKKECYRNNIVYKEEVF